MAKIVYNACFGGFSLSNEAIQRYAEIKGLVFERRTTDGRYPNTMLYLNGEYWSDRDIPRNDPALAQVVEELGVKADGAYASLQIEEVPDGSRYRIDEYDGSESVETPDSYEWSIA